MSDKEWEDRLNEMDPDQIREIEAGEEAGLDVSIYAKKEFLAIQMQEIRKGLKAGLDVSAYARQEYDWFQMKELRKSLQQGLDITKFSSPDISYDRMRQVRKGLLKGLDLTRFVKLDADILRQLRKAYVSKVSIVEYVKKGYQAEQLEEIRIALEKGLDMDPYLTNEYRGVAIRQIRLGLEEGLDVARYAKIEYSWRQMREIRLGMEGRIDTTLYENPLYSASQMKELRVGLEEGLDVSEYHSLMYTVTDMKRIHMRLLEELAMEIVQGSRETLHFEDFLISVSSDGMEAYLEIFAKDDRIYKKEDLEEALHKEGIVSGILQDELDRMVKEKIYHRGVLVAKGTSPQKGQDGWYEYFFNNEDIGKPEILRDGSVDYQSIRWFEMVEEGEKVACYHEATEGIPGKTVRGAELKTTRGKERKILKGKGFIQLFDKKTYVAAHGGKVELDDEKGVLNISKVCVLNEVTLATGNIDFDGCVYVKGDVGRGTTIKATEDVVIDGGVEAANIKCGGSALLRQGMNGDGSGRIVAEKNIEGKFFEAVKMSAGKDIRANYCLNCHVNEDGAVVISGTKGVLAGGKIRAVKGLECFHLGNRAQLSTLVSLGINDHIIKTQRDVETKIASVHKELTILGNALMKFQRTYSAEVRNTMDMYIKIENAIYTKELEQEKLYKKKMRMDESIQGMAGARAMIRGRLHEGCMIEIDKLHWVSSEAENVTVKRIGNRIAIYAN